MPSPGQNEYYEALLAVFCLIAYSDGEMHTSEMSRFVSLVKKEPDFRDMDEARLLGDLQAEIEKLDRNFLARKEKALKNIQAFKNDFRMMEKILMAGRIALIADGRIHESEEANLAEIHKALGITERN